MFASFTNDLFMCTLTQSDGTFNVTLAFIEMSTTIEKPTRNIYTLFDEQSTRFSKKEVHYVNSYMQKSGFGKI